jgi:hypothetical protein
MSQQSQDEYKTDAAMIDVLERHVLLTEPWSADIAARRADQAFTFDGYCTALTSWIRTIMEKAASETCTDTSGNRATIHPYSRQLFFTVSSTMLDDLEPCPNSDLIRGPLRS